MSRQNFTIPSDWTPEQAMAVVELLDALREQIWTLYDTRLLGAYREDRHCVTTVPPTDDSPF